MVCYATIGPENGGDVPACKRLFGTLKGSRDTPRHSPPLCSGEGTI